MPTPTPIRIFRLLGTPAPGANLPKIPYMGFTDTFARPDAGTLGSTEDGKAWLTLTTGTGAGFGIAAGQAALTTSGSTTRALAVVDSFTPNGHQRVVIGSAFNPSCGLAFRVQDASNHLFVNSGQGTLTLWARVNGAAQQIAIAPAGNTILAGDVLDVYFTDNAIQVWRNGIKLIDTSSALFKSCTLHGLLGYGSTPAELAARWDSITVTPN